MGETVRTPEVDEAIVSGISQGKPLAEICRELGIDRSIVYDWRRDDEQLDQRIVRARVIGFDAIADECVEIADAKTEDPASRRVRVDTRLKLLSKWDPKRYGDASTVKLADADGEKIKLDEVSTVTRLAAIAAQIQARQDDPDDAE